MRASGARRRKMLKGVVTSSRSALSFCRMGIQVLASASCVSVLSAVEM